jgi:hypothetical protein
MVTTPLGTESDDRLSQVVQLLAVIAERSAPVAPPPKYLTVQEAAAYCRVAVQTIYNNRRHIERMPGVGKLLFTRDALDRWLSTRKAKRR